MPMKWSLLMVHWWMQWELCLKSRLGHLCTKAPLPHSSSLIVWNNIYEMFMYLNWRERTFHCSTRGWFGLNMTWILHSHQICLDDIIASLEIAAPKIFPYLFGWLNSNNIKKDDMTVKCSWFFTYVMTWLFAPSSGGGRSCLQVSVCGGVVTGQHVQPPGGSRRDADQHYTTVPSCAD